MKICTVLFLLRGDEILLAMKKRGFGAGYWNGTGGKVGPNEAIEEAAIRECQEEIGVTPRNLEKAAVHDFKFQDSTTDIQAHVFTTKHWQGEPVETEEMAPKWFNIKDIPYGQMWEDDIVWLPLVLQGKKLQATFTFGEGGTTMSSANLTIVSDLR